MLGEKYIQKVLQIIDCAWNEQQDALSALSDKIFEAVRDKHSIYVFGCGHAGMLAEEAFYRAGGLAVMNPIFYPGFMTNTKPITLTSDLEKMSGVAKMILSELPLKKADLLIIHSVSGRNHVPVEMALYAKEVGAYTACITSLAYSSAVSSRQESGKRLFELCDIVIDNKGVYGDAAIELDGFAQKIGPTSTVSGAALLNAVIIEAIEKTAAAGIDPPVFMSGNTDAGEAYNRRIIQEYSEQIHYC